MRPPTYTKHEISSTVSSRRLTDVMRMREQLAASNAKNEVAEIASRLRMRWSMAFWLVGWGLASITGAETIRFDSAPPGSLPAGWTVAITHTGEAPKWEVRRDASAPSKPNVLAQLSADRTDARFPMVILNTVNCRDG